MIVSRLMTMVSSALLTAAIVAISYVTITYVIGNSEKMPVGDLAGWRQTGFQDFSTPAATGEVGTVYGQDMRGYSGFPDSSGNGLYMPNSVLSVDNGKLIYFLHAEEGSAKVASVIPFGYSGQKYGRYSVRFRYDALPGYKIAFLLWPTSNQWADGEVDWPEGDLDGRLYGASAIKGSSSNGAVKFDPSERVYTPAGPNEWHIATIEWTPGSVKWFWDGGLVGQTTVPSGVPDRPMRWTLQAETSDRSHQAFPEETTQGNLEIDWVVQYAYAP